MKRLIEAIGILFLVLVGEVAVGKWVMTNKTIGAWDNAGYELFAQIPRSELVNRLVWPFNFDFLSWSGTKPSYIYFLVGGFLGYMLIWKRREFGWAVLTVTLASAFILAVAENGWKYIYRPRPFLVLPSQTDAFSRKAWDQWSTYPSGHVRETALYATIIAMFIPAMEIPMMVFVAFIGLSRLYLGAHYPSDVIVGAVVGWGTAISAGRIVEELKVRNSK